MWYNVASNLHSSQASQSSEKHNLHLLVLILVAYLTNKYLHNVEMNQN